MIEHAIRNQEFWAGKAVQSMTNICCKKIKETAEEICLHSFPFIEGSYLTFISGFAR